MDDQIYTEAASILAQIHRKESSLRNLVFGSQFRNTRALYRLCCQTLKLRPAIDVVIRQSDQLVAQLNGDEQLAAVLLYDFLFGKKLSCTNKLRMAVERNAKSILAAKKSLLDDGIIDAKGNLVTTTPETDGLTIPKYLRVNTLCSSLEKVVEQLEADGWTQLDVNGLKRKQIRSAIAGLRDRQFFIDPDLENLLVVPRTADFHRSHLYSSAQIAIQDKSSCLVGFCLNPSPNSHVVDACAAPGMKTSHLAALIKNQGKIFAFDRDYKRTETTKELLNYYGVTCAEVWCQDFLKLNVNDKQLKKVHYAIVDPPCSGSGIVSRQDGLTDGDESKPESRLNSLGNLQAMLLKHALSLPSVKRLVYSTCSIYERENEDVIKEALEAWGETFHLVDPLPHWKYRGRKTYEFGHFCLRASPKKTLTNGFFVAVFERI